MFTVQMISNPSLSVINSYRCTKFHDECAIETIGEFGQALQTRHVPTPLGHILEVEKVNLVNLITLKSQENSCTC